MSNHPGEAQRPTDGRNSNGKKVRVGIVGCGEAAQILHWPSLYQLADLYEVTALSPPIPAPFSAKPRRLALPGGKHFVLESRLYFPRWRLRKKCAPKKIRT